MRARGPFEVKPRQLRALVLLLVLLPLLPTTFVVRFLFESVGNEQIEARERTKPRYQQFLDNASAALAVRAARDLPGDGAFDPTSWWNLVASAASPADAVLLIQRDGRLMLPPASDLPGTGSPQTLARAVLASGVHYAALPRSGPVRWRFFSETPEPLFALHPRMAAAGPHEADEVPSMLLIRRRQRLLDSIRAFYQRTLDPQTTLHLLDENGDSVPLVGPDEPEDGTRAKPLLAETALPPPLPTWRVRLYSVDAALVDGVARGQIALYWWTAGGMFLVTAGIAGAVGWTLTRRIALHELGNDSLAVVSHEMKTPLASTRLFIETLLDRRYRDPEQADEYLRLIAAENVRLERLVDSFQTAARVGSGRRQRRAWLARRETVRAEEIVAAACDQLRARLNARDGDFEQEIEPGIPPFPADRETLVAALVNLLDNAWKYTGADKRIRLRVRQSQDGGHAWLTFEVSDNGIGIERDEQGRIFERFYQSDARLSRAHEGVGLGLSIVRSVVRAHGGTVSVQSKPGKGSTFTLRLPLPAKKR